MGVAHTSVRLKNAFLAKWQDFALGATTWLIARDEMKEKGNDRGDTVSAAGGIAVVGLYGLPAYQVSLRRLQFAIRIALGARADLWK